MFTDGVGGRPGQANRQGRTATCVCVLTVWEGRSGQDSRAGQDSKAGVNLDLAGV